MKGYIHSTESFGTVDGPGIRFVVFFQGCPLRCLYCHNPDTWELHSANKAAGTEMSVEELLDMYDGVKEFCSGGITATGGEPLMQMEFLTELFEEAQKRGINTCLDTSGVTFTPGNTERFDRLMKSTDLVMLDIKHIDNEEHIRLTGKPNTNILEFAKYLSEKGIVTWVRHVTVPGVTYNDDYLFRLGEFLSNLRMLKALDVLRYHDMGKVKYENLGLEYPLGDTPPLTKDEAAHARDVIMNGIRHGIEERKKAAVQ